MIIPITVAPTLKDKAKLPSPLARISHDEFVLIELQGSLIVECSDGCDRNGQLVGRLEIDETGNKPTLTIAHHLLEGTIVSLAKPLAILSREPDTQGSGDSADKRWSINAVVKRKITFSKRPMPITRQA